MPNDDQFPIVPTLTGLSEVALAYAFVPTFDGCVCLLKMIESARSMQVVFDDPPAKPSVPLTASAASQDEDPQNDDSQAKDSGKKKGGKKKRKADEEAGEEAKKITEGSKEKK